MIWQKLKFRIDLRGHKAGGGQQPKTFQNQELQSDAERLAKQFAYFLTKIKSQPL
jgi:hypothetical protein